jgi:hypothetical protein
MKQGELKIICNDQTKRVLPDYIEIARKFERYVQTDMQRVRKLEQTDTNISDLRLRIEGIVYSILNAKFGGSQMTRDPPKYYQGPQSDSWMKDQQIGYPLNMEPQRSFRDNLEDLIGRREQERHYEPQRRADLDGLKRDARILDDAIRETIQLLRAGRIVPEDFIRRYRSLMRDSYHARRELERYSPQRRFDY